MDFDEVLPSVGEFGRYQKLLIWLVFLPGIIPCAFNAYNQLFMALVPEHWCRIPELEYLLLNQTDLYKNISIPTETVDNQIRYSRCKMRDLNYSEIAVRKLNSYLFSENVESAPIIPCQHGWNYNLSQYESSVVIEWDLVCDKEMYPTIALAVFGVGGLVGTYVFGYIQDSMGRKPAFFIFLAILGLFGIATAFATNFILWTVFRFGVGFTIPSIMNGPIILALELVGPKYRTSVSILTNIMYSISLVGVSGVVYFIRDWRVMTLSCCIPFLLYFFYWFFMPESPRWLLSQGKIHEMNIILVKLARINKKPLNQTYMMNLEQSIHEEKYNEPEDYSYGVLDLVRTRNLRMKTMIITFIWFVSTSVYVGLSYYAPALGGDEYLNFFLAAVVELPTYFFLWPAMEKWGRRWILCISMVIGGSACLATIFAKNDSAVTLGLFCIGKMGISCCFVVVVLITSELYPTVIRGLGLGICSVFGGFGPIIIPFINHLGTDMLTLPLVIMGAFLIVGGLSALLLPETLHKDLPETIKDSEQTGLNYMKCCERKKFKQTLDEIPV